MLRCVLERAVLRTHVQRKRGQSEATVPRRCESHVSEEENNILISDFTEEEVKKAIFGMKHNKAPGCRWVPGGILLSFLGIN